MAAGTPAQELPLRGDRCGGGRAREGGAAAQARWNGARRFPGYGAFASRRSSRAVPSPLTRARCSSIRALGATRGRWRRYSLPSG